MLARRYEHGELPRKASAETVSAAALFADISGFTALTERLTAAGPAGLEELTRTLNDRFGRLIDTITSHGGDILKFAGDSLLAIWPSEECALGDAARTAAQCGLAAQAVFHDQAAVGNSQLSLRITIGAGALSLFTVGGVNGRWEMVAKGEVLEQLGAISHSASPGEVAVSGRALELIGPFVYVKTTADLGAILESVSGAGLPEAKPPVTISARADAALRSFVPPTVMSHLESGSADWIGESRRVSVMFTHFPGLTDATSLERAQWVMAELQSVVEKYEGTFNKLSVDDKGAAMLAAFGLPPLAHEDDPSRALQAAIEIRRKLGAAKVRHSTGITTGRVFCGVIGNSARREYTIIGDVVNLSARLMQAAREDILCDEATRRAAQETVATEPLTPILVKGKASPIPVFRPGGTRVAPVTRTHTAMVGREEERAEIARRIEALSTKGEAGIILIQGDAGIGKSRLLEETADRAGAAGIPVLTGGALHVERFTPYYMWRTVFLKLCGLEGVEDPEIRRRRAAKFFGGDPYYWSLLPLANTVLGTDYPDTDVTAALDRTAKPPLTNELLVHILATLPDTGAPKVVILDDCQWADASSFTLAVEAARKVPGLLLVISSRLFGSSPPEEYQILAETPGTALLRLQALPPADAVQLAALRLGVHSLPGPVAALIREKAEGHPLFTEELAYALRDTGVIEIQDGKCRVSPSAGDLSRIEVPDNVQAAMTSRIDRLPNSQQLMLKVASVIGRVFHLRLLGEVYPIAPALTHLRVMVKAVADRGMVFAESEDAGDEWAFRHVILQRVAYSLMLQSQRCQLHRAVARRLETTRPSESCSQVALLAYHWGKLVEYGENSPEIISKVAGYLRDAADIALRSAANREAIGFLREALRFCDMLPEGEERDRMQLSIQTLLGKPLLETAGFAAAETKEAYRKAWDLCMRVGTLREKYEVLFGALNAHMVGAKIPQALALAAELYKTAEESGDISQLLGAHSALAAPLFWAGRVDEVTPQIEVIIRKYKPEYNKLQALRRGPNPLIVAYCFRAWVKWIQGFPDQAVQAVEQGFSLADVLSHPFSSALMGLHASMTYQFRGEAGLVLRLAESQLIFAEEKNFVQWRAGAVVMHGWALCEFGELDVGIAALKSGVEGWQSTGAQILVPYYLSLVAAAHLKNREPYLAMEAVTDALTRAESSAELWWLADILRLKGEIECALGTASGDEIRQIYSRALEVARRNHSRSLELRVATSFSKYLLESGGRSEGQSLLAGVLNQFTEGLGTADVRAARAVMEQLEEGRSGSSGGLA